MKFYLLFFSALLCSITNASEMKIYSWVDDMGKVHFSDTAIPGTQEVKLKNSNLLITDKNTSTVVETLPVTTEDEMIISYKATISSPEDDQALRSNDGTINIHVSIEPKKENTQTLQLYLDGKKFGEPHISQIIEILNIDRGTHLMQVELLNDNGEILATTPTVTVHLLRATTQ